MSLYSIGPPGEVSALHLTHPNDSEQWAATEQRLGTNPNVKGDGRSINLAHMILGDGGSRESTWKLHTEGDKGVEPNTFCL